MANKVLALLMVVAVAGVALGSLWLSAPGDADASGHSATRSFSSSSVAPGEEITVTIQADDYGGLGQILETLPSGFTSPDATGQTLEFTFFGGPQTITYTVTASDNPGGHFLLRNVRGCRRKADGRNADRRRDYSDSYGSAVNAGYSQRDTLVLIIVGRPWRDGNGDHPGRQLRWVGTDCGDPAFRLHQPGRERPDRDAPVVVGWPPDRNLHRHRFR